MANGGKYAWHRYWQLLKIEFTWFRTLRSVTTGNASIMPSAIEIDWIKTTLSHTHWSARFIIHMDRPQLNIECRYLLWFPLGPPCDSFLLLISFAFVYLRKSHKHFDCVPKFISGVFFCGLIDAYSWSDHIVVEIEKQLQQILSCEIAFRVYLVHKQFLDGVFFSSKILSPYLIGNTIVFFSLVRFSDKSTQQSQTWQTTVTLTE